MINKITLFPLFAIAAMALPTANSQAQVQNEVTRLAHSLERVGREIKNEFQTHYKRSSAYRHLMTDINEVLKKADHIHQIAHDPRTSYKHIKADLADLDKLAHHLHNVVDDVERGRYSGYVEDGLAHVHRKMQSLNDTIHSMERAIIVYAVPVNNGCAYSSGSSYSNHNYHSAPRVEPSRGFRWWFGPLLGGANDHGHGH